MSARPDAELSVPHSLYRCFDASGQLLYIGVARNVGERMFHHLHLCNAAKTPNGYLRRHMKDFTVQVYPSKLEARAAERAAINVEAPLLNRQHNPSRFRKNAAGQYEAVAS